MTEGSKLLVAAAASLVAHVAIARALDSLPEQDPPPPDRVEIRVMSPPEPAKEPEPEPAKMPDPPPTPKATPIVHDKPRARPPQAQIVAATPKDTPPADHAPVATGTTDKPVFGVTLESTSQGGTGPAMPIGNTTRAQPGATAAPSSVEPLAAPVAAYEATRMPLPEGRCSGTYTDDARQAGVEGTVVLDLVVGADGATHDIQVVSGLPHGLTEAAIAALRTCRFSPGEKDGQPVAVRVRGFKIRFVLSDP